MADHDADSLQADSRKSGQSPASLGVAPLVQNGAGMVVRTLLV